MAVGHPWATNRRVGRARQRALQGRCQDSTHRCRRPCPGACARLWSTRRIRWRGRPPPPAAVRVEQVKPRGLFSWQQGGGAASWRRGVAGSCDGPAGRFLGPSDASSARPTANLETAGDRRSTIWAYDHPPAPTAWLAASRPRLLETIALRASTVKQSLWDANDTRPRAPNVKRTVCGPTGCVGVCCNV